ncbi:MAG: hypothetical protein ACTSVB_00760 [Candidatus Heimdallarchaeaceae archaeon]
MGIVVFILKAIFYIALMFVAACVGMCLGAVFGLFMGPIKIIEWTQSPSSETSEDRI